MSDQHILNVDDENIFQRGRLKSKFSDRFLWTKLFWPKHPEDFIGKSKADFSELIDWLGKWSKKLNTEKERHIAEKNKKKKKEGDKSRKRRRSSNLFFEEELTDDYDEENEDDDDFELIFEESISNPAIISGPTGCGKSVMVSFEFGVVGQV